MNDRFNPERADLKLAVIGTGIMGRGIAQISAVAGIKTYLFDQNQDAVSSAISEISARIASMVTKGKLKEEAGSKAQQSLIAVSNLTDIKDADIVVEAIKEDLTIKRKLFASLEEIVSPTCLLATNTSSLSVTAIQASLKHPGRFGGFHFFNPVPLMKIAEVIPGLLSEDWVAPGLLRLTERLGHKGVRAKDFPGFIVNHAGRGYGTEALRVLGESIATEKVIDETMKAAGFRMGPFELLDLIGLDISHTVMESIYNQFYQEPRYRPSPIAQLRMEAGLLGRKSGRGFYNYDGKEQPAAPKQEQSSKVEGLFWIANDDKPASQIARDLVTSLGGTIENGAKPSAKSIALITPMGTDATTTLTELGLSPEQTIALDTIYPSNSHITLMTSPGTSQGIAKSAQRFFSQAGRNVALIEDSAGFVAQRIIAMIVNIGCDIAQQGIAEPSDIDLAVTLGLGYPKGPLAMGDAVGAKNILTILEGLLSYYGDPRYRPSPWLKRRAALGLSLTKTHA